MTGNLLLIDDEPILLKMLKLNLKGIAENIFTAESGKDGLDILANNQIHCVVCDINMPGMNGIEVIKKLRETNDTLPFIFYTGHGNKELMQEAAKFGAFDFLDKPNLDGLEEVVSRGLKIGMSGPEANQFAEESLLELEDMVKGLK